MICRLLEASFHYSKKSTILLISTILLMWVRKVDIFEAFFFRANLNMKETRDCPEFKKPRTFLPDTRKISGNFLISTGNRYFIKVSENVLYCM